jgi:hypothetical protein
MPPNCRPECSVSSECSQDKACVNQKCIDPCPGTCGSGARCNVLNHSPICSCPSGYTGDPFVQCLVERSENFSLDFLSILFLQKSICPILEIEDDPQRDPCVPSPCGPYSTCRNVGNNPACSCVTGYIGKPPNCRPECTHNSECPPNRACNNEKCSNPCVGSCGVESTCTVNRHSPVCTCRPGFTGDPFSVCYEIQYSKNFLNSLKIFKIFSFFNLIYTELSQ